LADSLAKPGRNFTGVTFLTDEMAAKRMELLKEVAPETSRVAIIFNPQHFDDELTFARKAAASLGVTVTTHPIETRGELDGALQAAKASQADGLFVIPSRLTRVVAASIASFGLEYRVPVAAAWREFVVAGALLSYGPSVVDETRRVASYVQKVLNGARPADLPIEQPVRFELVVNLKTARAIGLTIGRDFLLRADDLIE
jgi:putative tryptophan/tyrosine transport system substrate-binding protein